ncbi:MAG: 50S ribosomal protein L10 [Anaerolineae bacterium]|nr:50S ribosomal protein L10 [Thermoflexales bacterium]MDW8406673.1 50S ribosomal protein L10 [Anaerolineae bacterium]
MAVSREKKEEILAGYRELLSKSQAVIITHYGGLNMPQLNKVRSAVRGAQAEFHVTKNTLIARAFKEAGYQVPDEWLTGATAVSFCFGDPPAAAKAIQQLSEDLEKFKIVGGVLAGAALNAERVKELATMPSLDTLRAQLIGLLSAPASGLVSVLNAAIGGVMYALQAKIDKEQPAGEAASA